MEASVLVFLESKGYKVVRKIGQGASGRVYLVQSLKYNDEFVVKQIVNDGTTGSTSFMAEATALKQLNHPNIIRLFDIFEDGNNYYLVMEYCPGGSFQDAIRKRMRCRGEELIKFSKQILEAVHYCHSKNIAHRDIKPGNILIDAYRRPKLADFGISKNIIGAVGHTCGTRCYMAPEIIQNKCSDMFAADIWALGITFYEMASGLKPWPKGASEVELERAICLGLIEYTVVNDVPYSQLLRKMIDVKPAKRLTAQALLEQPIIKEISEKSATDDARNKRSFVARQGPHDRMITPISSLTQLKIGEVPHKAGPGSPASRSGMTLSLSMGSGFQGFRKNRRKSISMVCDTFSSQMISTSEGDEL